MRLRSKWACSLHSSSARSSSRPYCTKPPTTVAREQHVCALFHHRRHSSRTRQALTSVVVVVVVVVVVAVLLLARCAFLTHWRLAHQINRIRRLQLFRALLALEARRMHLLLIPLDKIAGGDGLRALHRGTQRKGKQANRR